MFSTYQTDTEHPTESPFQIVTLTPSVSATPRTDKKTSIAKASSSSPVQGWRALIAHSEEGAFNYATVRSKILEALPESTLLTILHLPSIPILFRLSQIFLPDTS
ncbi:hypothetical protein FRC03_009196 [Tulasnella sp. 419]|nr:hypothetical protein FRC03_009196 [Tulasnella sp. 419]